MSETYNSTHSSEKSNRESESAITANSGRLGTLSIVLIVVSGILILAAIFAPRFLVKEYYNDFCESGQVGDTIGGLANPFIAMAGVLITFLAFYLQYRANKLQVAQFQETQRDQIKASKEQLFYRLIDNLQNRILTLPGGYSALGEMVSDINKASLKDLQHIGIAALAHVPEKIDDSYYIEILKNITRTIADPNTGEDLKKHIVDLGEGNERKDYIKLRFLTVINQNITKVLENIGDKYFFDLPASEKDNYYTKLYSSIYNQKNIIGFIDGYIKKLLELAMFAVNMGPNSESNFQTINYNISTPERLMIFYYYASDRATSLERQMIYKLRLLSESFPKDWIIGGPDEYVFKNELLRIVGK